MAAQNLPSVIFQIWSAGLVQSRGRSAQLPQIQRVHEEFIMATVVAAESRSRCFSQSTCWGEAVRIPSTPHVCLSFLLNSLQLGLFHNVPSNTFLRSWSHKNIFSIPRSTTNPLLEIPNRIICVCPAFARDAAAISRAARRPALQTRSSITTR